MDIRELNAKIDEFEREHGFHPYFLLIDMDTYWEIVAQIEPELSPGGTISQSARSFEIDGESRYYDGIRIVADQHTSRFMVFA